MQSSTGARRRAHLPPSSGWPALPSPWTSAPEGCCACSSCLWVAVAPDEGQRLLISFLCSLSLRSTRTYEHREQQDFLLAVQQRKTCTGSSFPVLASGVLPPAWCRAAVAQEGGISRRRQVRTHVCRKSIIRRGQVCPEVILPTANSLVR